MIHLFTALACEAMPLVEHYGLKEQQQDALFRIFTAKDGNITLTITGVGKTAAAAAVSFHHARCGTSPADIWLNIGIAGHADLPLGEACLVNKITDATTSENWYPQILFDTACHVLPLVTLDNPSDNYQPALYDMEAAGFYAIASRLGSSELIHCFKVVSDNATSNSNNVKAKQVRQYIEAQYENIDAVLSALTAFSTELEHTIALPEAYQQFLSQWHFTQTQRLQLQQLLRRWQTLYDDTGVFDTVSKEDSARSVLRSLTEALSNKPFAIVKEAGRP